jgi:hypothetical protein
VEVEVERWKMKKTASPKNKVGTEHKDRVFEFACSVKTGVNRAGSQ